MDAFPHSFPCRIDKNARTVHCNSCEVVPSLLDKIEKLETKLDESRKARVYDEERRKRIG